MKFITNRKDIRKNMMQGKNIYSPQLGNYDCLQIVGGPLLTPTPFDFKYYQDINILDQIEDGFYDDFDPYDLYDVYQNFPHMGQMECLQILLDHAAGDFEVYTE